MKPIVSPYVIYLAHISENLAGVLFLTGMFVLGAAVIKIICIKIDDYEDSKSWKDIINSYISSHKLMVVTGTLLIIIALLLPSKDTIYAMIIAKNVTSDNIDHAVEVIHEVVSELNSVK